MPIIKFSHRYKKLADCAKQVFLLEVINVKLENLSECFLSYDTDGGKYQLPKKGDFLMLIFRKALWKIDESLFTTLRRRTPQKEKYYRSLISQPFVLEIKAISWA